jgi:hypothetical protein
MGSGYYTDKLPRRKSVAVLSYLVITFGTAAIAWQQHRGMFCWRVPQRGQHYGHHIDHELHGPKRLGLGHVIRGFLASRDPTSATRREVEKHFL